jgi:hypothetical protein
MQTKLTIEPTGSPVPGVMSEPLRVHHAKVAAPELLTATSTASGTVVPASSPGRRNPAGIVLAKFLSTIRGDKYMVDAYRPAWHGAVAARTGDYVAQPSHDGEVAARVPASVASAPDTAALTSRMKER